MITTLVILGLAGALLFVLVRGTRGGESAAPRDREILVRACVEVADLLDSDALREQLLDALDEIGVRPVVVCAGEPFDSSRHRAVGRVPTTNATFHNLIAGTERAGYSDGGRRLRWPDVLVFDATGEVAV